MVLLVVNVIYGIRTHRIHGTGILYLPTCTIKNQLNVGKYTIHPMDPYGYEII